MESSSSQHLEISGNTKNIGKNNCKEKPYLHFDEAFDRADFIDNPEVFLRWEPRLHCRRQPFVGERPHGRNEALEGVLAEEVVDLKRQRHHFELTLPLLVTVLFIERFKTSKIKQ